MTFSTSIFTLEVNHRPLLVFEAKWAMEAEPFAFSWVDEHAEKLTAKGSHGTDLPPVVKIRIARQEERATYFAEGSPAGSYQGLRIVYLVDPASMELG